MRQAVQRHAVPGFTLVECLIGVTIVGLLVALAIPNLRAAQQRAKYVQAACDSKTAVVQGIVYANEKAGNPGSVQTLREHGYVNTGDTDPWGSPWVYSPVFADTGTPARQGEMGVCSLGPRHTGVCRFPLLGTVLAAPDGSVGYSSLYGALQGVI